MAAAVSAGAPLLAACSSGSGSPKAWDKKLSFIGWDYQPDTIKKFLSDWGSAHDTQVELSIIPSLGYSPALQSRLRGGSQVDVFYNFAYNTQKFVAQKWAQDLRGLPGVDEMVADMFPSAKGRYVTSKGAVVSVPYFSAVDVLHYNKSLLAKAGIAAPPATLEEYYTQSKTLKANGVQTPFMGFWNKDVLEHYLNTYLLAAGITPFDDKGEPAFADDPKTTTVFDWWQTMYQEGLVQKSALTDDPGKIINNMATGSGAFWIADHYVLRDIHVAKAPESDNVVLTRVVGDSGKTLQFGEVVQMGGKTEGAAREAAWKLMKYYGWKDESGNFTVFRAWAKAACLLAPYPAVFKDAEVRAAFPDYMNLDLIQDIFEKSSDNVPVRTEPWFPAFTTQCGDILQKLILGQADAKATVKALTDAVRSAKSGGAI
ncbi:ABC transporter substrate-binding protein [Dactylosporangium sp. NPDC048998]|uniref:ABC transporter substrate-binding protein n=1 Tax=Dactylosporangium sp. NPDC048998 TaxID=3363976 RepID=UPI00372063DC